MATDPKLKPIEITAGRYWEIAQAVLLKRGRIDLDTTSPIGDRLVVIDDAGKVRACCYPTKKPPIYMEIKQ